MLTFLVNAAARAIAGGKVNGESSTSIEVLDQPVKPVVIYAARRISKRSADKRSSPRSWSR